ncbi:MAG: H-NS histone family protein [Roseateles sp.]|nr:MAG: H-NS histone family protein [Roseateles sp.]
MAKNLKQLLAQIGKLQGQADALKQKERLGVIERIQEAVAHYGLTADEIFAAPARKAKAAPSARGTRVKAAKAVKKGSGVPKYQDVTGRTWTGRGKRPTWFVEALAEGKAPESMLIKGTEG